MILPIFPMQMMIPFWTASQSQIRLGVCLANANVEKFQCLRSMIQHRCWSYILNELDSIRSWVWMLNCVVSSLEKSFVQLNNPKIFVVNVIHLWTPNWAWRFLPRNSEFGCWKKNIRWMFKKETEIAALKNLKVKGEGRREGD